MMPLTMINPGAKAKIRRIGGSDDVRRFLANLGFIAGSDVEVLNLLGGSMIVKIKDSRVALNADMARHIFI